MTPALAIGSKRFYDEATVAFEGDPLAAAARLLQTVEQSDFVLYERDREWSLGVGVHAHVAVYLDKVAVTIDENTQEHPIAPDDDLSVVLQQTLAALPVAGWRAYGIATFDLARRNYGLPIPDDQPYITLFVPQIELRIRKHSILVRALDRAYLEALRSIASDVSGDQLPPSPAPMVIGDLIADSGAEPYMKTVEAALKEIHAQQYRKVILSRKIELPEKIDLVESYVAGRKKNAPARSFVLRIDGLESGGFSPETVVEVTDDRNVFTTPLAGTRSTGDDLMEELRLQKELLSDSKEIAEHAISVYVAFNDLAMCCDLPTIRVINFMIVARRGAVQHLASRLQAELSDDRNPWHAFNALFPGVTVSGVPKPESVDAIGRIEPVPRGLYAGCVMICDSDGGLDATVTLRSFYQKDGKAWVQAGAGIMNMSRPERELEETREKLNSFARYLVAAS